MFDKDITIVNKTTNGYVCNTVKGYWQESIEITTNNTDIVPTKSVKVFIPRTDIVIKNDDYLIKGIVSSIASVNSLSSYQYFKVTAVALKDYGGLQHIEVSGE